MTTTLIFDLDGTISDPSKGFVRSINHAFRSVGLPELEPDVVAPEIGPPLEETLAKLQPGTDESVIGELISAYRSRYSTVGYAENVVYTGIPEAIEGLLQQGIRLGICTSKRKDFAEKILSTLDLLHHFAFVDGGDIGVSKTEQLAALLQTGVVNQEAVMIGDRHVDMEAAKASGLSSVGVLWGFGDREELSRAGAGMILSRPNELPSLASVGD
jgi:phosphoglycolate phosphatase